MKDIKPAILKFIDSIYQEILDLEMHYQMQISPSDFRNPIEQWHDSVRALTSNENPELLSVNNLSSDLQRLRQYTDWIGSGPKVFDREPASTQTSAKIARKAEQLQQKKRDSSHLSELYANYTLLYAALMQETLNINYKSQLVEINTFVSDASALQEILKEILEEAEINIQEIKEVLEQCHNEDLKLSILMYLKQMAERNRRDTEKEMVASINKELERLSAQKDRELTSLEKAHFSFLSAQLIIYQNSQDIVKSMAAQGLNLAGRFVEQASMRDTGMGTGRKR